MAKLEVKEYFISDDEQIKETVETMTDLTELLHKVAKIPGITIYIQDRVDLRGFKIRIEKEILDA